VGKEHLPGVILSSALNRVVYHLVGAVHCDGFNVGSRERIGSEAKLMTYCVRTWSALVSRWVRASVTTVKDCVDDLAEDSRNHTQEGEER